MQSKTKQPEKVGLSGAQQTLLITLHGKAIESRRPDSLLKDRYADEAVHRLDCDFSRLDLGLDGAVSLALRAKTLDDWTRAFISRHADAVVLHLGCGLDSRVFRIEPPSGVLWFDIDLPDVIELRRRVYAVRQDNCAGDYRLLAASVTDAAWLEHVPRDRPVIVVAEGLMPYLPSEEAPRLVARLVRHAASGELVFDGYNELGLSLLRITPQVRATGAEVHYAIDEPASLEQSVPGLRFIDEMVQYDSSETDRMSWSSRLVIALWRYVPALRKIGRLLRYQWGPA